MNYLNQEAINLALNYVAAGDELRLVSRHLRTHSYAQVQANTVVTYALAPADFTLADNGDGRQVTIAAKSGNNAAASTNANIDSGTAESATANSLTDTDKAFTVDEHAGRKVTITAGTGVGQSRVILSNTANTLTPDTDWVTIPDNTSQYQIADDLVLVVCDSVNSKVLYASDETSDQQITSGNPLSTPAFTCILSQPKLAA